MVDDRAPGEGESTQAWLRSQLAKTRASILRGDHVVDAARGRSRTVRQTVMTPAAFRRLWDSLESAPLPFMELPLPEPFEPISVGYRWDPEARPAPAPYIPPSLGLDLDLFRPSAFEELCRKRPAEDDVRSWQDDGGAGADRYLQLWYGQRAEDW